MRKIIGVMMTRLTIFISDIPFLQVFYVILLGYLALLEI